MGAGAWVGVRVLTVPIDALATLPRGGQAGAPAVVAMPGDVTALVVALNVFGTTALVGFAIWSAWQYARCRANGRRTLGNLLIAAGALIVGGAGSLARLGRPEYLFLGELTGVAVIFAGFLLTDRGTPAPGARAWQRSAHRSV